MTPLRAVIFDLDDTLYTMVGIHDLATNAMRDYAVKAFGISGETFTAAFDKAKNACMAEMPKNATSHSRLIWAHRFCEDMGYNPFLHAPEMEAAYWDTFIERIKPKEGAVELLDELHKMGLRIGLCTDMQIHIQHRKVRKLGFETKLDAMMCSDVSGFDKPRPEMFAATLKQLKCKPEEAIMTGDSLKKDVLGPIAVGIGGIWFNDLHADETGVSVPIAHDYSELRALILKRVQTGSL